MIGRGGMGVVYEAVDNERGGRIALKTLRTLEADALLRFKSEFRRLSDIHHPNLVSLGELVEEEGRLFFTMELVEGVNLIQHVRPGAAASALAARARRQVEASAVQEKRDRRGGEAPWLRRAGDRFDEAKLRSSFGQLVKGLRALHQAQKVHRDVKPSNVLVTEAGRVVVVDFGLILDFGRDERDPGVVGTAHFLSPEQVTGGAMGPAADWYGVGAALYLALTGYYPFRLPPEEVIARKRLAEPPRPRDLVDEALPTDLEALAVDLLRLDPAARPGAAEILRRLGVEDDAAPEYLARPGFVGRARELSALRAALGEARFGQAVAVLVEGESGMGKTALLRRFLDELRTPVVLYGRCYERESVPYKAVDEVIDALCRHLVKLPAHEVAALLPPDAGLLGVAFPVLGRVEAIAEAATMRGLRDPVESRAQTFAALRELLRRLAAQGPLVIAVDDLQWADPDGAALLAEILRPPHAPALLLVATVRTGPGSSVLPRELVRRLRLDRLPDEDARALLDELLSHAPEGAHGGHDGRPRGREAHALLAEAGGHPLFIDALLRHRLEQGGAVPVRLDDALWARIQRLDPEARRLCELLALAGGPIPREVAARALGLPLEELGRLDAALRAAKLARTGGVEATDPIEPYHDRVRETVTRRLDAAAARHWHERLALALEELGSAELEVLAVHFREAGHPERAAGYAERAGAEAEAALAFDRAARLYRMALALGAEPRALRGKLADALANAGRGAEAAVAYLAAIPGAHPVEAIELRRRAADSYLRSGYFDEGIACLRDVLDAAGMHLPRSPARALGRLLLRRVELRVRGLSFRERPASAVDPEALRRIDICWSAALGLGMIDNVRGAVFQTTNLLLSLEAGEPYRVARALALEVPFVAVPGGPARRRAAELLAEAGRVAARAGNPHTTALIHLFSGISRYLVGQFPEAIPEIDSAEVMLREPCPGATFERGSGRSIGIWARWFTGDLREFCRRVPLTIREAEERGDRYLATNLRSYLANAFWLVQDDPAAAAREARCAVESWSKAGFHLQHMHDLVARVQIALYLGSYGEAHRILEESWGRLSASLSLRMQTPRIYVTYLRGAAAVGTAAALHAERRGFARRALLTAAAARAARALEGERMPWADPLAALLRAGGAATQGDAASADTMLARAQQGFRASGMALLATIAGRRRGEVLGGDRGAALTREADRWMRAQGVVDPGRLAAMLAPGFA